MTVQECLADLRCDAPRKARETAGQHLRQILMRLASAVNVALHRREDVVADILLKVLDISTEGPSPFTNLGEGQSVSYLRSMLSNRDRDLRRREKRRGEQRSPITLNPEDDRAPAADEPVRTDPVEAIEGVEARLEPLVKRLEASRPKQYRRHLTQAWDEARALSRGSTAAELLGVRDVPEAERKARLDSLYKRQQRLREALLELARGDLDAGGREEDFETAFEDIVTLGGTAPVRPHAAERPSIERRPAVVSARRRAARS